MSFREIFDTIYRGIQDRVPGAPTKEEIEGAQTEKKLIELFTNSSWLADLLPGGTHEPFPRETTHAKSRDKGKTWMERGRLSLQQKRYKDAVVQLSEAARVFPNNFVRLSINPRGLLSLEDKQDALDIGCIYDMRSEALTALGRHRESLGDADTAVIYRNPYFSMYRTLLRKAENLMHLDMGDRMRDELEACGRSTEGNTTDMATEHMREEARDKIRDRLIELTERHKIQSELTMPLEGCDDREMHLPDFPGMEPAGFAKSVEATADKEFGNHVRAVRDVRAGDTVLSEEPFKAVLCSSAFRSHCYNCFAFVRYPVEPCRACTHVCYCSVRCEKASWSSFHKYECGHMDRIRKCPVAMSRLALLATLAADPGTLQRAVDGRPHRDAKGSFLDVYNLMTHFKERDFTDRLRRAVAALYLSKCCNPDESVIGPKSGCHMAACILRFLYVLPCNAHEISALDYRDTASNDLSRATPIEIGEGIYPRLSLFNHSCDPHVTRNFYGRKVVMRAVTPIAKGDQVFDNYGALWPLQTKRLRRDKLLGQYFFECRCPPCTSDWPLYDQLTVDEVPRLLCCRCSYVLADASGICIRCRHTNDRRNAIQLILGQYDIFGTRMEDFVQGRLTDRDALPQFLQFMTLVSRLAGRPFRPLNDCGEAIKQVYAMWGNVVTSWPESIR